MTITRTLRTLRLALLLLALAVTALAYGSDADTGAAPEAPPAAAAGGEADPAADGDSTLFWAVLALVVLFVVGTAGTLYAVAPRARRQADGTTRPPERNKDKP